jgi:hypothetical protein
VIENKVQAKSDAAPAEAKPDAKGGAASEVKSKSPSDLTPQLVERVHALYEELGRQDVLAVQELEQSEKESKEKAVP